MNPLLSYGIQVIIVSGLLYSYYHVVLRNKKFHHYNRFYLLAAAGLSVLIPLLNIPVYFSEAETESSVVYNTLRVFATAETDEGVTIYASIPEKASWFTTAHIFQLVYSTIALLVLLRIIFSLLKIRRIIRRHPVEKIENIHFLNTDEPDTPFSFFRWLFWNRKIELNSEKGEQIFRHELFHIEQKHSLDIIFLELLTVAGWFNPFFHLMKRETKAIHEFLADQFAVTENNRWDYAELLLMQVLNTNQKLVHPFFHNQIKRRIAMITSPQKTSHQYLRKLMVLPLTILSIFLFAFSYKEIKKEAALTTVPEQKISADTTIKPTRNVATFDKMVIVSDSIIFKSFPSKAMKDKLPEAIVFMNGKRVFQNEYAKKTILCDSFEYYSPDDKKAIELYGPEAKAGVMIIHNGKITDTEFELKEADKPEADKIFDKVEIEASFPGGSSAWRRYLERNLDASIPEKQKAPAGNYTVVIQFIVNLDGTVSDVRALTNHGYGMETEAIRAIKKGPKWLPAIQNGRKIVAYRKQPITFVVDNEPRKEIILYNTTQVKNSKTGYALKLAADELYIGIDNIFRFDASGINVNELVAAIIPNGRVEIKKDEIIINVNSISESHLLSLFITEGNKKTLLKTIPFKVRIIPLSEIDKSNGTGTAILTSTPEKTVSQLKTITVCEALGLPAGTEVISYDFTIDTDNGEIVSIPNTGITFNPATKKELLSASAGKLMTFDSIRIRLDGKEKRVPSRVYLVVN